jgi:hypothetical protein
MNRTKLIWLNYLVSTIVATSSTTAASRMAPSGAMRPMHPSSVLRPPMIRNSVVAPRHFNSASRDRFTRFRRFNDGDHDFDDRRHRFNEIIIVDDFGFPFFPFFYPYPYFYYPYGYYYYNQPAYGGAYGSASIVAQVQERLARAGYYHGAIDGVIGRRTRSAIRAYERAHNLRIDGVISRQLVVTMGLRY